MPFGAQPVCEFRLQINGGMIGSDGDFHGEVVLSRKR
jgi:hypothetical protein